MSSVFFPFGFQFKEKLGENKALHRLFKLEKKFIFSYFCCEFLKLFFLQLSNIKPL